MELAIVVVLACEDGPVLDCPQSMSERGIPEGLLAGWERALGEPSMLFIGP
jgi:hypothetical protein